MDAMTFTDRFLVAKVKWSGKTERILGFRPYTFATMHPKSGEITNEWSYEAITSLDISLEDNSEFTINMFGLKKKVSLKLRHRYRAEVLQALSRVRAAFAIERRMKNASILAKLTSFDAHVETFTLHQENDHQVETEAAATVQCTLVDCVLQVGVDAVYQLGGTSGRFPYFELTKLQAVELANDDPTLLVLRMADLSHLFHVPSPNDVVRAISEAALAHDIVVSTSRDKPAVELQAQHVHFTPFDLDTVLVSYDAQFPDLSQENVVDNGSLVLTDSWLLERDHSRLITFAQPLTSLYEIVRNEGASDEFDVEFGSGLRRTYYSVHRDAIIAHLLDACKSRGTLVRLNKTRTASGSRLFLRRMLMKTSIPAEVLWYQVNWLHRLVGGDKPDTDSAVALKTPSLLQHLRVKKKPTESKAITTSHLDMVLDFNSNVPLCGLSSKIKDNVAQATSLLITDVPNMVLLRQPDSPMDAVAAYFQCLYRLVASPVSAKQALEHFARSEYMDAMADILKRNEFQSIYAVLQLLTRLLHGPDRLQSRKVFLSHNGFFTALLALFQIHHNNPIVLGQVCHVLEALLSLNVKSGVDPLFNILLNHLSMHYSMLVRTLCHFAPTATVEACVCIMHHMIHTTVLSFSKTHDATCHQWNTSHAAVGHSTARTFWMESPERMIKQYHSFLMAHNPADDLRHQTNAVALRLRYRYRAHFLQHWMHLVQGNFDVAIECLGLDAVKHEGSKMTQQHGQIKSAIYVVPSGLVVTTPSGSKSTYDFSHFDDALVGFMAEDPCGLVVSINDRHRVVYSYERGEIFDRMQSLAGQLGIQLDMAGLYQNNEIHTTKPTVKELGLVLHATFALKRVDPRDSNVQKPKLLALTSSYVVECDENRTNVRLWSFDQVHQITRLQHHDERFELVLANGKSLWYDSVERDVMLATLLDACMHVKTDATIANGAMCIGMHIAPTALIMPLLPRCILRTLDEREFYFGQGGMGMYYLSKISHSRDTFVDAIEEFNSNCNVSRDTPLHFTSDPAWMPQLCKEMSDTLMMACKTRDMRSIVAILQAFCWLQHAHLNLLDMPGCGLLEILLAVHTTDNEAAIFWAITLLHALSEDATGSPAGKAQEVANKQRIFMNSRLVQHLLAAFDDSMQRPLTLLAVAALFDSIFCTSRHSTNNVHFADLVVAFGKIYPRVLSILYHRRPVPGTFESCVMIMKTVVENSDVPVRMAICNMALDGGLTLRHFYKAIFATTPDQRFVHQFIASIWMTGHAPSFALLQRILPSGFLRILSHPSTKKMMMDMYGDGFRMLGIESVRERSSIYSRSSIQFDDEIEPEDRPCEADDMAATDDLLSERLYYRFERYPTATELDIHARNRKTGNYTSETCRDIHLLAHLLLHSFALPDLIWNPTTSKELKYALEEALVDHEDMVPPKQYFTSMAFAWNHCSFRVQYASLNKEIRVGPFYLRILMDNVHDGLVLVEPQGGGLGRKQDFVDLNLDSRKSMTLRVNHSIVEIATHPQRFFDQCFQRWLQELPFSSNPAPNPAFPRGQDSGSVVPQHDNAEIWCLQLMVATYKAYSIGSVELEKVAYVVRMLRGETRAPIIEELLSWLSTVASDKTTSLALLTKHNMELFLDMSTLVHEHTPLQSTMSNVMSKKLRSMKSLKQLQLVEQAATAHNRSPKPFSYFNFFKRDAGDDLDVGETNIDTIDDNFQGEVYWYIMTDNDLNSVSGPHPESILLAICTSKGTDWSHMLLSMYNDRMPDEREWRPLLRVPRVRWRLFVQSPLHVNVCIYTTSLVRSLVEAEMDRTPTGLQLMPVPAGKRYLSDPFSLACVVQLLLCQEPAIVENAISILHRLVVHNEATATNLYRCGAIWFMFASASRVSFYEHAVVLELTHRRQAGHHSKSVLDGLLPQALVRILDLDGPTSFADVFAFQADDHRVLWTESMRDHLQDMLHEHLAPFVCRLHQDSTATFEYSPMPPVIYMQLQDDIYVYNMHLSRLFADDKDDEGHVPTNPSSRASTHPVDNFDEDDDGAMSDYDDDSPASDTCHRGAASGRVIDTIDDPLAFMRAVHSTWRQEIATAEGRMSKAKARQILQLDASELDFEIDGAFLRSRFRAVCLSDGIDIAELNEAFVVLSCVSDSTCELDKLPHKTLSLLLRTQLLFYDTFPSSFQSIPYDAYDLLLKLLAQFDFRLDMENPEYSLEHDTHAMELLSLSMELLLATMISSPWNVEQMLRAQGLSTIIKITDLCRRSQTGWVSESDSTFDYIGGLSVRVLLAVANTDVGRDELAFEHENPAKKDSIRPVITIVSELIHQDVSDVNINMIILALDILSLMGRQEAAQTTILDSTMVFWHALQLIVVHGAQMSKQQLVCAALRCVRVLAGYDDDTKPRVVVQTALTKLIPMWTPTMMQSEPMDVLISSVFQDLYVPQFIWFDDMRREVQAYLDTLLEFQVPTVSFDAVASQFSFDALEGEPVVGGIFLRVYKQGPVRTLPPAVAVEFCELLLVFLYEHALPDRPRYDETLLALECFALLTETSAADVQRSCLSSFSEPPLLHALGMYMTMGIPKSNGGFDVDAVQRRDVATTCMQALARHCDAPVLAPLSPFCKDMLAMAELQAGDNEAPLTCLEELCAASPDVSMHILTTSAWIELFSMTIQAKHYVTEDQHVAAETLRGPAAEVWYELLHGAPEVQQLALERLKMFLPYSLVHTLKDDPEVFEEVFEESAYDAELIWNDQTRGDLRMHVDAVLSKPNPTFPDDRMDYSHLDNGLVVGDFYLDLFLQNPEATSLRHPCHIASQLVAVWQHELAQLMPLASQSMMSVPLTLPDLVDRHVENAGLVNKLTNALVFIYREYVDVKATTEDTTTLCKDLVGLLAQCQSERAIGFPQTCVLRLIQVFATNGAFNHPDCIQSLFAPLARKHQDPALVLDILRTIFENHLAQPKRLQLFNALQLVRDLDMMHVLMSFVDGSADLATLRRPVECQALANAILRMLQPLEQAADHGAAPRATPAAAPVGITSRMSLPNLPTAPHHPMGRSSLVEFSRPGRAAIPVVVPPQPVPTLRSRGRQSMPTNHPYGRQPFAPRSRKTMSDVSIDTHSVDSVLAPLPPSKVQPPLPWTVDPTAESSDIYGSEPLSTTTSTFHRRHGGDSEDIGSEYEVDDPSEVDFDLHSTSGRQPEYDM
ncbi:hypothetical protein, variant [Aphanomyces invadans]|uniref:DnaJ homologue subfamily C GRV2/DNAJC13 N-terminal domain-containing protein n=1 Tax=Aphanomyces invadans TaxID=157072 RepID=A0A024UH63_9STRA|nr:hypothetical protein, variant [Aphanomyces invadans]ETW05761.1 hypothetical protein, variant [Aphanomyces invadans]|eukprot:XP_008865538.1 hypothetical protein, variant [Aphanomyces invadans]